MEADEYDTILKLTIGDFNVPVAERTRGQKSAIVKFYRLRSGLSVEGGKLFYNGKRVLKRNEIKRVVKKTFTQCKSGGYKKLRTYAADGYAGLSNNKILKVTTNDITYKRFNTRFNNKAAPKPIIAREVQYTLHYSFKVLNHFSLFRVFRVY